MCNREPPLVTLPLGREHPEAQLTLMGLGASPKASCISFAVRFTDEMKLIHSSRLVTDFVKEPKRLPVKLESAVEVAATPSDPGDATHCNSKLSCQKRSARSTSSRTKKAIAPADDNAAALDSARRDESASGARSSHW